MKLAIIGSGYVGLVTGACFAGGGNTVVCLDVDEAKVARLRRGEIPIYEPGLEELIKKNAAAGRLFFTASYAEAIPAAELVFLAVGTPSDAQGRADLTYLQAAADQLAEHLSPETLVVIKSTVPVGTNAMLAARLAQAAGRLCRVASNPEFLKEGAAIHDFRFPDRVVVGVRDPADAELLRLLYEPFLRSSKLLVMSPESAELTKYAANAMLAARISFMNEIAAIAQASGADIGDIRAGIGSDGRIGTAFLYAGVGYGGSCFPKDVRELAGMARQQGVEPRMLDAINGVNDAQKLVLLPVLRKHFGGSLRGAKLAMWGLAFKAQTDDIREAPALVLLEKLLAEGAAVCVHDPAAMENVREKLGDRLRYSADALAACDGAAALIVMTPWDEFAQPDFAVLKSRMLPNPAIFDGRNLLDPRAARAAGFAYHGIGRP